MLALSPGERNTLLSVRANPPEGLVELRGVLARDQAQRIE